MSFMSAKRTLLRSLWLPPALPVEEPRRSFERLLPPLLNCTPLRLLLVANGAATDLGLATYSTSPACPGMENSEVRSERAFMVIVQPFVAYFM